MVPVVYVIKELIQFISFLKSWSFGYYTVIGREKWAAKATKHSSNGQFKLWMAIKGSRVKDNWPRVILSHISCPHVPMQEGRNNFYITEQTGYLQLQGKKKQDISMINLKWMIIGLYACKGCKAWIQSSTKSVNKKLQFKQHRAWSKEMLIKSRGFLFLHKSQQLKTFHPNVFLALKKIQNAKLHLVL